MNKGERKQKVETVAVHLFLLLLWHAPLGVCIAKRIDISLQSGRF